MRPISRLSVLVLILVLGAACATEPPEIVTARERLAARMAEDPGYREYALSVLAGSAAPHARALTLEAIAGANRAAAAEAIRGLVGTPDAETLAALEVPFQGAGSVKALAATHLAGTGHSASIEWLATQLQQGQILASGAMAALAEAGHETEVKEALQRFMANEDLGIRNEAYEILGAVRKPWASELLLQGMKKEFGRERVGPIVGLGRSGDVAMAKRIAPWVGTQGLVTASIEALANLGGEQAMQTISSLLGHDEALVRAYASTAAWRLAGGEAAEQALVPLLTDEDPRVRQAVASQLGNASDDRATEWLRGLAADSNKDVRVEAYRALVARGNADLATLFATGAQDPDYEVATIALAGLAAHGAPADRAALTGLLDSENPYLQISAAHAVLALADTDE